MLEITGAAKYYKKTAALNGLRLSLGNGEIVGLFGESGAGKTTLLKALTGLCGLNGGYVALDGAPLAPESFERLSFITSEGSFFPNMTPRDHGEFYGGMLQRFKRDRFARLLEFFDLPEKKAHALSKGQRMKLEFAIGMSRGADYFLIDEPFFGIDALTRRDLMHLMIALLEPNESVLIATHQISEIETFITRLIVMKAGKIIADESIEALSGLNENLFGYISRVYEYDESRAMRFMA